MDEIETFRGLKARLIAAKSDPRMLPRQQAGICYVHTALNTILNSPLLLTTVMNSLKSRIDESKYSGALGGRNLRNIDPRLTISDGDFIGKVGVVGMDVINDVVAKIGDRDADEGLKQWCKDTILYTALRDAKASDLETYPINYDKDLSADALYLAVARQDILADDEDIGMKTLVRAGEGGNQLLTLFDILKSVANVDGTSSDQHIATFADGTCFVAEKTLVPENTKPTLRTFLMKADPAVNEKNLREITDKCNGWDRTGNLIIRRMHLSANPVEEGHGVVYFRDEDHKMRIIDSNHHRNWSIDEYLDEMKKSKSRMASSGGPPKMTMDEYPWMITEVITYFTAKVVLQSAQSGGGRPTASEIPDSLAAQIAGACLPMSEEAQIAGGVLRTLLSAQQTMG